MVSHRDSARYRASSFWRRRSIFSSRAWSRCSTDGGEPPPPAAGGLGLSSAAFHPGVVATSFGVKDGPSITRFYGSALARVVFSSPARGGSWLVRLAEGTPGVDWASGQYWVRGRVGRTSPQADDADVARSLWEASAEMVGLG